MKTLKRVFIMSCCLSVLMYFALMTSYAELVWDGTKLEISSEDISLIAPDTLTAVELYPRSTAGNSYYEWCAVCGEKINPTAQYRSDMYCEQDRGYKAIRVRSIFRSTVPLWQYFETSGNLVTPVYTGSNISRENTANYLVYGRNWGYTPTFYPLVRSTLDEYYGVPYHVQDPLIGVWGKWAIGYSTKVYDAVTYNVAIPTAEEVLGKWNTVRSYYNSEQDGGGNAYHEKVNAVSNTFNRQLKIIYAFGMTHVSAWCGGWTPDFYTSWTISPVDHAETLHTFKDTGRLYTSLKLTDCSRADDVKCPEHGDANMTYVTGTNSFGYATTGTIPFYFGSMETVIDGGTYCA